MVATISKQDKPLSFIGRAEFKANGYILYRLQSGEKIYEVTLVDGKITGCQEKDGEMCKGRRYTGHCKHGAYVLCKEQERIATEHKIDEDIEQHIDEELIDSPIDPRYQVVPGKCNGCGIESKWAVCHRCSWQ